MKILGLDSSGIVASVAIVEDENLIAEYTVNYKKTHSQTLLPMLDELVKMTELDLDTILDIADQPGTYLRTARCLDFIQVFASVLQQPRDLVLR